ncbi:hypothetical protein BGZ74_007005 [Mortierella antarctica]|nr:hypothetical protein BGZ74_007005 [Mortierella antarctica]
MSSSSSTVSSHDEASDHEKTITAKKTLLNKDREATPEQELNESIPEPQETTAQKPTSQASNGEDADGPVSSTPQTNGHHAESEQPHAETGPKANQEETEQQPESSSEQSQQKNASFSPANGMIITRQKLKRPPLRPVDLTKAPEKSILKKESAYPFIEQPARNPIFKSQWLQSTVSKLAAVSGPQTPTAYTANSPSMFRKLVTQATAATQGTPNYASSGGYSTERPLSHLEAVGGSSASLLSDKSLKRVQFSVGQLTTEHVFHHDDAYESADESELPVKVQVILVPAQPKKLLTTTEGVVVDDNIYTAKEIMNYYLVACNNREEFPIDRLVADMRAASSRPSNPLLTTIDLTGEPLPRKTLDPISDVLTLEFGLSHLVLDNCSLEDDTLKMLLYSLLLTDTLTSLSVQDNKKIKSTGFKYIAVFVKKTKSLKSLNVSGIPLDKKSIEFLAHALKIGRLGFGSRLEELRMDRCGMRGALLETMAPAIRESNLRHLSLRSNRIGASGGVWIGVLMRDYDDQPNKAIPNNNEEQGFRRVFPGIVNPELLKRTRGVESLDVSDNDLRQGADYIAQTLRRNMSLKRLVMANNNLDHARLVIIADALKLNIGLHALDLSNNKMCGPLKTGVNALTSKLTYNKTLTKLCLSNTGLQSEGAIALAEFLPETRTLAQLDLTGNDLVDIAGVMALAVSIRMNKSLTCLDMNVPPNDAEFARLSRDILRACIRNMEEQTGSNAGMPSPDDMPTTTIFRQPSPPIIPEHHAHSAEDARWKLLEGVACELYVARDSLRRMERMLDQEKALRHMWMQSLPDVVERPQETEEQEEGQERANEAARPALVYSAPLHPRQREILNGVKTRGTPEAEQLFHQCKRHQASLVSLIPRVDNDKALHELHAISNMLNMFTRAYLEIFELPPLPTHVMMGKRTNSLPPQASSTPQNQGEVPTVTVENTAVGSSSETQENFSTDMLAQVPVSEEPSFMLTDDEDVDDDDYTFDAMIDVRRNSLLDKVKKTSGDGSSLNQGNDDADLVNGALGEEEAADRSSVKGHRGRGPKPAVLDVNGGLSSGRAGGERSPSILASPLEQLRKAAEEEEGEVLRRGKELLENGLENGIPEDALTGEELKQQILSEDD